MFTYRAILSYILDFVVYFKSYFSGQSFYHNDQCRQYLVMVSNCSTEKLDEYHEKTIFLSIGEQVNDKIFQLSISAHTVNFRSEMGSSKHASGKNIFCSMNVYKSRGKRIFEIVHCPFELPPN